MFQSPRNESISDSISARTCIQTCFKDIPLVRGDDIGNNEVRLWVDWNNSDGKMLLPAKLCS